jgi:SAM-dependent methyltransferase
MSKTFYSKEFWKDISKTDPYFGVLSDESFKNKNLTKDKIDEFYKSGEIFIDNLFDKIKLKNNNNALDFGCGAGRLTFPLTKYFKKIFGYDISNHYIDLCKEFKNDNYKNENLNFFCDYKKIQEHSKYDFINSYIVFQHIPEEEGYKIILDLLKTLNLNGVFHLHLVFARSKRWLHDSNPGGEYFSTTGNSINFYNLELNFQQHQKMSMYTYDLNYIFQIINRYCTSEVITFFENHSGNLGLRFLFKKDV